MSEANQQTLLDAFKNRESSDHFATLVENSDIAANDYNIAVSSYVEAADTREVIDIDELNAKIEQIVTRQAVLRVN